MTDQNCNIPGSTLGTSLRGESDHKTMLFKRDLDDDAEIPTIRLTKETTTCTSRPILGLTDNVISRIMKIEYNQINDNIAFREKV